MKRAVGYGLVLLAASIAATRSARARSNSAESASAGGTQFFLGSGPATVSGAQGYFGVDVRDVTADQLGALKLKEARGAEITQVDHDAPAGKAGLREHDVVLQMNGQTIDGREQIRRLLHDSPPGKTIVLLISRDGQQMTVTTQMSTHEEVDRLAAENRLTVPEPPAPPSESTDDSPAASSSGPSPRAGYSFLGPLVMNPSYTGAMLEKMSAQLADYFGVPSHAGLLVRSVQPNSPAALAGMTAGDVVIRINQRPASSTGDWAKAIKNSHGQPLTIVVLRDKKEQTLTLTPDGKKRSGLDRPLNPSSPDPSGPAVANLGLSWMPRS